MQQALTRAVENALKDNLQTDVSVGAIELELFNKVTIRNLRVNDQYGENLLKARQLSAKIEIYPLLQRRISLRTASLLDANINLYKKAHNSEVNFQFIIDAFASNGKKEKSPINLRINSVILRRVSLAYHEQSLPITPGHFNPHHLSIKEIDANISLKEFTDSTLNIRLRSLSFEEESGLKVKNLTLLATANPHEAHITRFFLSLPSSRIEQNNLHLSYNATKGFSHALQTLSVKGQLKNSQISLVDIAPFLPGTITYLPTFNVSTNFEVKAKKFHVKDLQIQTTERDFFLSADATLHFRGNSIAEARANVRQLVVSNEPMQALLQQITDKPQLLRLSAHIGQLHFNGFGIYKPQGKSHASFRLHTPQGSIEGKAEMLHKQLLFKSSLKNLRIAHVFGNSKLPEHLTATITGSYNLPNSRDSGDATLAFHLTKAGWQGLTFRDILLNAGKRGKRISLDIESNDVAAMGTLTSTLHFAGKKLTGVKCDVRLNQFIPAAFGLLKSHPKAVISAQMATNISSFSLQKPRGTIQISNFILSNGIWGDYKCEKFHAQVVTGTHPDNSAIHFSSDFLNGTIEGKLDPKRIQATIEDIAHQALPGLLANKTSMPETTSLHINLHVEDAKPLQHLFGIDIALQSPLTLHGVLAPAKHRTSLSLHTKGIDLFGKKLGNFRTYIAGSHENYQLLTQFHYSIGKTNLATVLTLFSENGALLSELQWKDANNQMVYDGSFATSTIFNQAMRGGTNFVTSIVPTTFNLANSNWKVGSGELRLHEGKFSISRFHLSHLDQMLALHGSLAPDGSDSIVANLQKIDIAFIMNLLNFHPVDFAGMASGRAIVSMPQGKLRVKANLDIPDFSINEGLLGHTLLNGGFDGETQRILLDAKMHSGYGSSRVDGYVSLKEKELLLNINPNHLNLGLLNRYIGDIFQNFQGTALSGYCRLYGPFKALDFEGSVRAEAEAFLPFTGVKYQLSEGIVNMTSGCFSFENFTLKNEKSKGQGIVSGKLLHEHLGNLRYNFSADVQEILAYDRPKEVDMPFFATAFGTGNIHIEGRPGMLSANIRMQPEAGTDFTYTVDAPGSFSSSDLVTFGMKNENSEDMSAHHDEIANKETIKQAPHPSTTDIYLNFTLDMNPKARVCVVTGEKTGDHIAVRGNGPLRATFYNKGAFQMFGTYHIERGNYRMSIQEFIRKDLAISPGSSITFAGDPYAGDLNLKAVYVVNSASLSDLNYGAGFSKDKVRVDCILNIGGKTGAPKVNFDLDLRGVSEDEKQMVRNLIATDEDMNRQIIYLLGVGRFYTENYGSTEAAATQSQSSVAMKSFLSSTLSGQLNEIISSAMGEAGNNWTFGTNLSTGSIGWSDMEVDGLLQGRLLNDRLLINGNFGYRENSAFHAGNSNFVGDFDVRYLLTPSGNISLKAYSETNDRYFTKSSLTTQGIGILLQREFSSLRELFSLTRKRKSLKVKTANNKTTMPE